jgi:hypothetical protein
MVGILLLLVVECRQTILHKAFINQLEPESLVEAFLAEPPVDFVAMRCAGGVPAFEARFDLLTTADDRLRQRLARLPGFRLWSKWLRWKTLFVGTPVSEYALFPISGVADELPLALRNEFGRRRRLTIIKDIPQASPLLTDAENRHAERVCAAAVKAGFVLLEGQALAHVGIDFASIDEYLGRLSAARRKDIRRKLRSRAAISVETLRCGDTCFSDPAIMAEYHALFDQVHAQSEIHFDHPTAAFFSRLFNDAGNGGVIFSYRHEDRLIGWNLCYEADGRLIDKYVGFRYPDARMHNLYFVSWMHNLEYALEHGLKHYVAGWTDPEVKAQLGAKFTFTRHAVYARNALLRAVLRRFSSHFESDRVRTGHGAV